MDKRAAPENVQPENANLTPMIDVTFQLLIFFMLVLQFSQANVEALTLPPASKAVKVTFDDMRLLIVNIRKEGTVKIQGVKVYDPDHPESIERLKNIFETRRQDSRFCDPDGFAGYPVLIRADRSTGFEHLQRVMMICTRYGGVYRVELGAREDVKR